MERLASGRLAHSHWSGVQPGKLVHTDAALSISEAAGSTHDVLQFNVALKPWPSNRKQQSLQPKGMPAQQQPTQQQYLVRLAVTPKLAEPSKEATL